MASRGRSIGAIFLFVLMSAPGVGAVTGPASQTGSNQGRPDFSGTWQAIYSGPPEPFRPGLRPQVNWGNVVTLTQDTSSLAVEYVSHGRSHARVKLVYRLDGTANMNIDAASVAPQERHTTAGWEGPSLVLTATVDWPDGTGRTTPRVMREVLSLESPDVLRLETTLTFRGETATATVRYRRR